MFLHDCQFYRIRVKVIKRRENDLINVIRIPRLEKELDELKEVYSSGKKAEI
jgi:hypothetical protein